MWKLWNCISRLDWVVTKFGKDGNNSFCLWNLLNLIVYNGINFRGDQISRISRDLGVIWCLRKKWILSSFREIFYFNHFLRKINKNTSAELIYYVVTMRQTLHSCYLMFQRWANAALTLYYVATVKQRRNRVILCRNDNATLYLRYITL